MGSLRLVTVVTAQNPNLHDLYLDDSGQLEWIGGDVTDTESYARMVAQRIMCRLLMLEGEWYQDQRLGTRWASKAWEKGSNAESLRSMIRTVIIETPGVRALDSLTVDIDYETMSAEVEWTVTTETNKQVSSSILDEPFIMRIPYGR